MEKLILLLLISIFLTACNENKDIEEAENILASQFDNNFKTIKNALSKAYDVECIYIDEKGEQMTARIRDNSIRIFGTEEINKDYQSLIKGQTMWMWDKAKKIGSITDLSKIDENNKTMLKDKLIRSADDIIQIVEKNRQSCLTKTFSDSEFEVPSDINIVLEN